MATPAPATTATSIPGIATWYALPEAAAASAVLPKPPDLQTDDIIVIALYHWENTTVTHPRGFTRKTKTGTRRSLLSIYWYRLPTDATIPDLLFTVADDTNPGTTHPVTGFLWAVRGAATDGDDPFEAVCDLPIQNYVSDQAPPCELDTVNANTLLLYCAAHSTAATITAPDGFHLFTNTSAPVSFAAGVKNNPDPGHVGPVTGTWTTANAVSAWLGAIRPAGAPPPEPPQPPDTTTTQPTPGTTDLKLTSLHDLANEITTAKDHAYTLAQHQDATAQLALKLCWERLDSALWCITQLSGKVHNPQPDQRITLTPPPAGNPINAQP